MSYMADKDHIAITSRDASTTGRKVFVPGCPVAPPNIVTHGESNDTYRRIAPVSEIVPGKYPPGPPGTQFAISYSANARHRGPARACTSLGRARARALGRAAEAAYAAHLERSGSWNAATGS
jgi:hypothetical protein